MGEETGGSFANRTWVDREYIHTTGNVDKVVCETEERVLVACPTFDPKRQLSHAGRLPMALRKFQS